MLEISVNGQTATFSTGEDLCKFWQRMKKVHPKKYRRKAQTT